MARILVTGAAGFIGRALCPVLAVRGHEVVAGVRASAASALPAGVREARPLGDIAPQRRWSGGEFADIDIVVHLAQRAHRRADAGILGGEAGAAAALARAACRAGARRLVYVSSIKAMGETTRPGRPFRADDTPMPQDAYGHAKLATEQALARVADDTGLDLVVVRPPLVYGPGVRGNFRALLRLAGSGLPLPLANIDNRRSLIFVDNLADLIATAVAAPRAAGTRLVSDGADFSTPALLRSLARGQGKHARLFGLPQGALAACRRLPGVGPMVERLTQSLQVDDAPTRAGLGWRPPVPAEEGLLRTARAFAAAATASSPHPKPDDAL